MTVRLSERWRELVDLLQDPSVSYREVSARLDIKINSIKSIVRRLRSQGVSVPERTSKGSRRRAAMRGESAARLNEAEISQYGQLISETKTPGLGVVREYRRIHEPQKDPAPKAVIFPNIFRSQTKGPVQHDEGIRPPVMFSDTLSHLAEQRRKDEVWEELKLKAKREGYGILEKDFDRGGE